jgi:hypothetical protein
VKVDPSPGTLAAVNDMADTVYQELYPDGAVAC